MDKMIRTLGAPFSQIPFRKYFVNVACCLLMYAASFAQEQHFLMADSNFIFKTGTFKACHASTIERLANGQLIAAWFAGTAEGSKDVSIWSAKKQDSGWSAPRLLADGKMPNGEQFACWNPVLFAARSGMLYLHYKVGPNPREWWAMYKTSIDNGETWSDAHKLPDGFLGPIKNKPIQLPDGNILYPSSTESTDEKEWKVHLEQSDENLVSWRKILIAHDTLQAIQPTILVHGGDRLQLLARSRHNKVVESWSVDGGKNWSPLAFTLTPNPNSGIDAVTVRPGLHILVYNPLLSGKEWWEGRSVLAVAMSADGVDWKGFLELENHASGEFSYPAVVADEDGNVYITYTYDRKNIRFVHLAKP